MAATQQQQSDEISPEVWRAALAIVVGAMAVIFDTTIVTVALNTLARDLHTTIATIQWVSTGYLLAMFVTIPLAGWAQSVMGGKRLWMLALAIFGAASVLCSCAWNADSLIGFRVLQGIGGGLMMPLMMTLIMQVSGGKNIGKVISVVALPTSLGPILGPVIGGIILGVGDWRALFWVNVPFCVVGMWLANRNLAEDRPSTRGRLDIVGMALLSPGVAFLIYGLTQVQGQGGFGSARVLVPALGGLALVAAFAVWARPRGAAALVNVRLFHHRTLASASTLLFLTGASMYGALLLFPLYFQQARGEDALGAGLLMIPQGVGTLCSRRYAGRFTDTVGPRAVSLAGFAVMTVATVPFAFVGLHTSKVWLLVALFVRGLGLGAATIPLMGAGFIGLTPVEVPSASIINRVMQQVGGSIGTALLAVILATSAKHHTLSASFDRAFWWSVGFTALAVPLSLLLPTSTAQPAPAAVEEEKVESLV